MRSIIRQLEHVGITYHKVEYKYNIAIVKKSECLLLIPLSNICTIDTKCGYLGAGRDVGRAGARWALQNFIVRRQNFNQLQ